MKQTIFAIIIVASFMFSGCTRNSSVSSPNNQTVSSLPATTTISVTATPLVLEAPPTLSATSTEVSAPTLEPVTPTITASPLPTATKTPIPIPTPPDMPIPEQTLWLFETNNGCQLPCWWGIIPGQTSWITAKEFLTIFDPDIYEDLSVSGSAYYEASIPLLPEIFTIDQMDISFLVRNNIVEWILTDVSIGHTPEGHLTPYILSNFLLTYGEPLEVWLFTYSSSFEEGDLPFITVLFYPQQGIVALYSDNGVEQSSIIQGCPQADPVSELMLSIPESDLTFEQTINGTSVFERDYLSLEEATGMDVSTFYETFKNPDNTVCLETPANLWEP